jgi:hypothetical protein
MEKAMKPRNRPKNAVAAAAALALTFLVAGCMDYDSRYDGRYDSRYDNHRDQRYSGDRYPTRNAPDGFYLNKGTPYEKRYHSYEHYADEMRNRRHMEQERRNSELH